MLIPIANAPRTYVRISAPFDEAHSVRTGQDSSLRQADEQPLLHHARNLTQPRRQFRRIGDALQFGVQEPVAAVGHEGPTVWSLAQREGSATAGIGVRGL